MDRDCLLRDAGLVLARERNDVIALVQGRSFRGHVKVKLHCCPRVHSVSGLWLLSTSTGQRRVLSIQPVTMSTCAKCCTPLTMDIEPESDEEQDTAMTGSSSHPTTNNTIPDDVALSCGCHFHWECLLSAYELDKCPVCNTNIVTTSSTSHSLIVDLNNEGGLQEGIDIFPILKEESYLRAYPEDRKCRAFLEFCREGDHRAIAELLKSCAGEGDDEMNEDEEGPGKSADEVLRYQDVIGEMESGLHAAVANGHREVAWMLLLLASNLPEMEFPALVYQEAAALGVMREDQSGKVDIRCLKDTHGRAAEDVAREAGVVWNGWIGNGRLAMP